MIVYHETVGTFVDQCLNGSIADAVKTEMVRHHVGGGAHREFNAWSHSLPALATKVFSDRDIDRQLDVAIEYKLSTSMERIDFLIYGLSPEGRDSMVSIELKQWSYAKRSSLPNFVVANTYGAMIEDHWHPSAQAYSYSSILRAFNEYVYSQNVDIESCSYCHEMPSVYSSFMKDEHLFPVVHYAPTFLQGDEAKLAAFIKKYVRSPRKELLYEIDNSKIRPSKKFSEMFLSAIAGNMMMTCDASQSYSVSRVVAEVRSAVRDGIKKTIIIKGGPGTGKSVVAINILGQLLKSQDGSDPINACYVTPNFTPGTVYRDILVNADYRKKDIDNLFKKMNSFVNSGTNDYDCIILDEAHRGFAWKFGRGVRKEYDFIDRLFRAALVTVCFVDEDQAVTRDDCLNIDDIKAYSAKYGSSVIEGERLRLTSQFRCLGGENYIAFINSLLGYDNLQTVLEPSRYDFKVFDDPEEMRKAIAERQRTCKGVSRMVAGYTHEWISKEHDENRLDDFDIVYPEFGFKMKWNKKCKLPFVDDPSQDDRVGCIHTVQGVDLSYCGVIIGKDLTYRNGHLTFDKSKNAKSDRNSKIRTAPDDVAERLIRNTYKVLLTRGIEGTYVYCEDSELTAYIKSMESPYRKIS